MVERVTLDDLFEENSFKEYLSELPVARCGVEDVINASAEGRGMSFNAVVNRTLGFVNESLSLYTCHFANSRMICDEIVKGFIGEDKDAEFYTDRRSYAQLLGAMISGNRICMERNKSKLTGDEPQPSAGFLFALSLIGCADSRTLLKHCDIEDPEYIKVHGSTRLASVANNPPACDISISEDKDLSERFDRRVLPFLRIATADYMDCLNMIDSRCVEDHMKRTFFGTHLLYFREEERKWTERFGRPRTIADALIGAMDWLYYAQGDLVNIVVRELAPTDENKAYYMTKCAAETVWCLLVRGPLHILENKDKFL